MLNVKTLVKNMNKIKDTPSGTMVECRSFTDNMIAAYDLNEADTSITFAEKLVYSDSLDRATWTVLETEYQLIDNMFNSPVLTEGKDNLLVRIWEKFKGWMKSFWNWITRKKSKSTSSSVSKVADSISPEEGKKAKDELAKNEKGIKEIKDATEDLSKAVDSVVTNVADAPGTSKYTNPATSSYKDEKKAPVSPKSDTYRYKGTEATLTINRETLQDVQKKQHHAVAVVKKQSESLTALLAGLDMENLEKETYKKKVDAIGNIYTQINKFSDAGGLCTQEVKDLKETLRKIQESIKD